MCDGNMTSLYKRLRSDILKYSPKCWDTRMIDGRRSGNPTDVNILNCFNMLSSGNRADRKEDVAYMAEEPDVNTFNRSVKMSWKCTAGHI